MSDAYKQATQGHPQYDENHKNWMFLLQSYLGGDYYRRAGHLTKYQYETDSEYAERLETTPLDNHCRGVIGVYNSFLFREPPEREFGSLESDMNLEPFLEDADLEGRQLDAFMKDVATWASVFGHAWIIVSKPQTNSLTRADELNQGVRPYVSLLTPLAVLDWTWARAANGYFYLTYLKVIEDGDQGRTRIIKEWTPEEIVTLTLDEEKKEVTARTVETNGLGRIPAVIAYSQKSPVRGLGLSDIQDISGQQKSIYNEYSEIEQSVRLQGHPSLVKTADVEASAGAGAIIQMPDNLDPGLKPYLLEPNAQNLGSIYLSIDNRIRSIDRMASMGSVRTNSTQAMSGVSREVEFQMLNSRLAEKADNLELAEEQMWRLWAQYQGQAWDGEIHYPDNFGINDRKNELEKLMMARDIAGTDTVLLGQITRRVQDLFEDEFETELDHSPTSPEDRSEHIQEMIMEGLTDQQILDLHPEILQADIDRARRLLLTPGE